MHIISPQNIHKIMKDLSRISLFLIVILIPQISNSLPITTPKGTLREIDLMGSFNETSTRSPQLSPIQATINSTSLDAEFLTNLENIAVEVYSATGSLIYENNVNTQTQQNISINVTSWDSEIYEIRFVNSDGLYIYGTFRIE